MIRFRRWALCTKCHEEFITSTATVCYDCKAKERKRRKNLEKRLIREGKQIHEL